MKKIGVLLKVIIKQDMDIDLEGLGDLIDTKLIIRGYCERERLFWLKKISESTFSPKECEIIAACDYVQAAELHNITD